MTTVPATAGGGGSNGVDDASSTGGGRGAASTDSSRDKHMQHRRSDGSITITISPLVQHR
jgi:hypothetical protein